MLFLLLSLRQVSKNTSLSCITFAVVRGWLLRDLKRIVIIVFLVHHSRDVFGNVFIMSRASDRPAEYPASTLSRCDLPLGFTSAHVLQFQVTGRCTVLDLDLSATVVEAGDTVVFVDGHADPLLVHVHTEGRGIKETI